MEATKDGQYSYSSKMGLVGEITQACLAIAARLLKEAYYSHPLNWMTAKSDHSLCRSPSWPVDDASSKEDGQTQTEASLSRNRSKFNIDRSDDDDQHVGDGNRNKSSSEKGFDDVPRKEFRRYLSTVLIDFFRSSGESISKMSLNRGRTS